MLSAGIYPNGRAEDGNTSLYPRIDELIVDAVPGLRSLIPIPEEEIRKALRRVVRYLILYGANPNPKEQ